jgi:uncharacterized small protein (DUF1192 family)
MVANYQFDDQNDTLTLSIVPELRRRITLAAVQGNLSEEEYIERLLEQSVPPETFSLQERSRPLRLAAIYDLLQYREEVKRAHPGQVLEDSLELLHQAREERTKELEQ